MIGVMYRWQHRPLSNKPSKRPPSAYFRIAASLRSTTGGLFFAGNRDTIPRKTGREGTYEKDRQLRKFHGAGGASAGGHPAGDGRLPHFLLPVRQGSRGHRHISAGRGGAGAGDFRSAAGQPQLPAAEGAASVKARFCNFFSIFQQRSGIMSRSADVPMQHLPESFACLAAFPAPCRR